MSNFKTTGTFLYIKNFGQPNFRSEKVFVTKSEKLICNQIREVDSLLPVLRRLVVNCYRNLEQNNWAAYIEHFFLETINNFHYFPERFSKVLTTLLKISCRKATFDYYRLYVESVRQIPTGTSNSQKDFLVKKYTGTGTVGIKFVKAKRTISMKIRYRYLNKPSEY